FLIELRAGRAGDIGLHRLPAIGIGDAENDAFGDLGILVDRLLDVARIDLVAAGDDDVLDAVDEEKVTVGVEVADIAGAQPATAEHRGGRLGLAPISRHDLRSAHRHFAALACRRQPRRVVERYDLDDGVRQRQPDRPRFIDAYQWIAGDHRRGLAEAVAFDQRAAGRLLELALDLQRQRRAAGDAGFDR